MSDLKYVIGYIGKHDSMNSGEVLYFGYGLDKFLFKNINLALITSNLDECRKIQSKIPQMENFISEIIPVVFDSKTGKYVHVRLQT